MILPSSLNGLGGIVVDSGVEGKNFSHHKARLTFSGQNCIAGGDIGVNKSPSKFDTFATPLGDVRLLASVKCLAARPFKWSFGV